MRAFIYMDFLTGKILGNESTMKDHPNVAGKGAFVVVMVTKKTVAPSTTEVFIVYIF